jgi:hypothetical protein
VASPNPVPSALVLLLTLLTPAGVRCEENGPLGWTRSLYEREVEQYNSSTHGRSADDLMSAFSPETRALWRRAAAGPGPKLEGPILHVFFGWGVLPNLKAKLKSVREAPDREDQAVIVDVEVRERPRRMVIVTTTKCAEDQVRCIDDIQYDTGMSLKPYLHELAGD